jgi:hypothetical protein
MTVGREVREATTRHRQRDCGKQLRLSLVYFFTEIAMPRSTATIWPGGYIIKRSLPKKERKPLSSEKLDKKKSLNVVFV